MSGLPITHENKNLGQPCQPNIYHGQPYQLQPYPTWATMPAHHPAGQPCQSYSYQPRATMPDNHASPTYINLGKPCLPDKVPKAPKAPDTISLTTHTIASSSHQQQGSQRPQRTIPVCSDIRSPLQNLHNQMLIYDVVKNTGVPNYLGAKIPLPHSLNMDNWRIYLHNYVDHMSKCHMQKFVKFFSYYWTSFFLY